VRAREEFPIFHSGESLARSLRCQTDHERSEDHLLNG
jgi:hypothetical protein